MLSVCGVCFQEQENNYCDIVKKFKKRQVQGHFFHSLSTCYRKNNFINCPSINLIICIIYRHYDKMIPQTFSRSLFSSHLFFLVRIMRKVRLRNSLTIGKKLHCKGDSHTHAKRNKIGRISCC